MAENDHKKRINFIEEIGKRKHGHYHVSTTKLRSFIDKFGVNYRDCKRDHLLDSSDYMSKKQIDIIFEHRVTPYAYINHDGYLQYSFLYGVEKHMVYILQKFLEQDDEFVFITKKVCIISNEIGELKDVHLLDFLHMEEKVNFISQHTRNTMIMMLQNHQKKYYRLFDLLKHHID